MITINMYILLFIPGSHFQKLIYIYIFKSSPNKRNANAVKFKGLRRIYNKPQKLNQRCSNALHTITKFVQLFGQG